MPELYNELLRFNFNIAFVIKSVFLHFVNNFTPVFLIVLDDYVENKFFGEDWDEFFLNKINCFAEKYFEINDSLFQIDSNSNEIFYELLEYRAKKQFENKLEDCEKFHTKQNKNKDI